MDFYGATQRAETAGAVSQPKTGGDAFGAHASMAVWLVAALAAVYVLSKYE